VAAAPQQSIYWLALELAVFGFFGVGAIANVWFWLRAASGPNRKVAARPLDRFTPHGMVALPRPSTFGRFLLDALFQRRLLRVSTWRWLAHSLMFWGSIILFFVGSMGLMLAEKGLLPLTKDTPWFAAVNDSAGLMVILGVVMSVYRYYRVEEQQSITSREGLLWLVLLGMIVLSGYVLESARLVGESVSPGAGRYSFVGYALAGVASHLFPNWAGAYRVFWWVHAGSAMALVAAIPYGRLLHMFASPLAIALNLASSGRSLPTDSRGVLVEREAVHAGKGR
jgi:nitrate reductase gamma subunit